MKNIFNQTERKTIKFWVDDFGTFLSNGGMCGVMSNARTRRNIVLCTQIANNINANSFELDDEMLDLMRGIFEMYIEEVADDLHVVADKEQTLATMKKIVRIINNYM